MATTPTAVRDRSVVVRDLTGLSSPPYPPNIKDFLRIPQSYTREDTILNFVLAYAKEAADIYCNNPFVDANGNAVAIPMGVELWICQAITRAYDRRNPGVSKESQINLGSVEWTSSIDSVKEELKVFRLEPGLGEGWG